MTTPSGSNGANLKRRRALFVAVALAIPVAFFVLAESLLRAGGHKHEYPLFIAAPGHADYLQANPDAVQRFFANPQQAPAVTIETAYFLADKPANGLRIFVQGGSSAAGFPYGYGASLAGMLEQRLRRTLPDRPVEVVSTAMSAVNSYTLLAFADEIIAQRPDAVLIYAGHNEYLGILGVGSALSSGLSPTLTRLTQWLRGFAVYQFVERSLAGASEAPPSHSGGTLMARIAREKAIPYGSELYARGITQFDGNLRRLLARYQRAGIPVVIGVLASNEKDLPPFVSAPAPTTDAQRWQTLLSDGVVALQAGQLDVAERALGEAMRIDDIAADGWYQMARLTAQRSDYPEARRLFLGAKDRDQLRFRAPEAINAVIVDNAKRFGATTADVQHAMAAASANGIIGSELMLEHVHPNLDGYFLLADTYFDMLLATGVLGEVGIVSGDDEARKQIPVSEVDRLFGDYKLARVMGDWPFQSPAMQPRIPEPANAIDNLAYQMYHRRIGWPQAMSQLLEIYRQQGNAAEYLRVALILADAVPFGAAQQFTAGTALIRGARPAEALRYLERGAVLEPSNLNMLLALSHARVLSGRFGPARESLQRVLALDPDNRTALDAIGKLPAAD